jgi:hypothetical protein
MITFCARQRRLAAPPRKNDDTAATTFHGPETFVDQAGVEQREKILNNSRFVQIDVV